MALKIYKVTPEQFKKLADGETIVVKIPDPSDATKTIAVEYKYEADAVYNTTEKSNPIIIQVDSLQGTVDKNTQELEKLKTDTIPGLSNTLNQTKEELSTNLNTEISNRENAIKEQADKVDAQATESQKLSNALSSKVDEDKLSTYATTASLNEEITRAKNVEEGLNISTTNALEISNKCKDDITKITVDVGKINAEVFDTEESVLAFQKKTVESFCREDAVGEYDVSVIDEHFCRESVHKELNLVFVSLDYRCDYRGSHIFRRKIHKSWFRAVEA